MFAIKTLISFQVLYPIIPKCDHTQWVSLKLVLCDDISKMFPAIMFP